MQAVKLVFGGLCGLGFLISVFRLLMLLPNLTGGAYNTSYLLGSIAGTLLWGALTYALFKSALDEGRRY